MNTKNAELVEKSMILASLAYFISKPPRLETGNYVSDSNDWRGRKALREERQSITRDLKTANFLLPMVEAQVDLSTLKDAFRAFSGRLSWDGSTLDYCTGQYYPTEYRKAVCAVLSQALWTTWLNGTGNPRETARRTLPKSVAVWFN